MARTQEFEIYSESGYGGTLSPSARASLMPIAIACLRFVTFFPERPERNLPSLNSSITLRTLRAAFLPYLRVVFFFAAVFFRVVVALRVVFLRVVAFFRAMNLRLPYAAARETFAPLISRKSTIASSPNSAGCAMRNAMSWYCGAKMPMTVSTT